MFLCPEHKKEGFFMDHPGYSYNLLDFTNDHLCRLDEFDNNWTFSTTEAFLYNYLDPDEINELYNSRKLEDLQELIEAAFLEMRAMEMQETPEFFDTDIRATASEKQLWLAFQENYCSVNGLDRVEAFPAFLGSLRNSSPAPYDGDVRRGVIDPNIFNLIGYFDHFAYDYFCSIRSSTFEIGEQLVALEILDSKNANWKRLIDSSCPDAWTEAVLTGLVTTREEALAFEQLEAGCRDSGIEFKEIFSTLLDLCESGQQLFTASINLAIASDGFRQMLISGAISSSEEMKTIIATHNGRQRRQI
jgi:hypothetical protein